MSQNIGRQIGQVQTDGAPSGGNRTSDAITDLTPANTRPVSLRPGAVLVGTSHNYGTSALGAIPQGGQRNLNLGTPPAQTLPWNFTAGDLAQFAPDGRIVDADITGAQATQAVANRDQSIAVHITSAQLLALHTAPVMLVAAPGAGLMLFPVGVVADLHFVTTAYVDPNGTDIFFGPLANAVSTNIFGNIGTDFIQSTADASSSATFSVADAAAALSAQIENQPLILATKTANMTDGDGSLDLLILYKVLPVIA